MLAIASIVSVDYEYSEYSYMLNIMNRTKNALKNPTG